MASVNRFRIHNAKLYNYALYSFCDDGDARILIRIVLILLSLLCMIGTSGLEHQKFFFVVFGKDAQEDFVIIY